MNIHNLKKELSIDLIERNDFIKYPTTIFLFKNEKLFFELDFGSEDDLREFMIIKRFSNITERNLKATLWHSIDYIREISNSLNISDIDAINKCISDVVCEKLAFKNCIIKSIGSPYERFLEIEDSFNGTNKLEAQYDPGIDLENYLEITELQ